MLERDADGDLLFPILSAPSRGFYAGHLPEGQQALIALSRYGQIIAAICDQGGNLIRVLHQEVSSPPNKYSFEDCLIRELGFSPSLIRIKEFRMPAELFAVYHLPSHFSSFLIDPNDRIFDEEDRGAYPEMIRQWHESGQFVLEWGNDYWLDRNGDVVSS
jgi:hypothetical protein